MKRLTIEELDRIRAEYSTHGPKFLSKALGFAEGTIVRKASAMGLFYRNRPKKLKDSLKAAILARYATEPYQKIAIDLGIPEGTVRSIASSLGLKTKAGLAARSKRYIESNDSVNIAYFDSWSSSMAYTLGFTFADGNVNKRMNQISYRLHARDLDILQQIKADTNSNHALTVSPARTYLNRKCGPRADFKICSTKLAMTLVAKHGLYPDKCHRDDPLPVIPDLFFPHFTRGYFDGDGLVSWVKKKYGYVGFCGTFTFLQSLVAKVCNLTGLYCPLLHRNKRTDNLYTAVWWRPQAIETIFSWMYPPEEGIIHGRRKFEKLRQAIALRNPSHP